MNRPAPDKLHSMLSWLFAVRLDCRHKKYLAGAVYRATGKGLAELRPILKEYDDKQFILQRQMDVVLDAIRKKPFWNPRITIVDGEVIFPPDLNIDNEGSRMVALEEAIVGADVETSNMLRGAFLEARREAESKANWGDIDWTTDVDEVLSA